MKQVFLFISVLSFLFLKGQAQKEWTFKECVEQALKNNISLNQADLSNQQNLINVKQAKANLIPTLNLSDGQGLNFGRTVDPFTNQFVNQNINTNNIAATTSVTIFSGMQNINTVRQSKLNYDAGNLDVAKMKNDIALNVAVAYLQVLFAYEQFEIAKKQLESTQEQLHKTELFLKVGKMTETNLLQIQSQLSSDKLTVTNAENQLSISKLTLMQLMEIPINKEFEIQKPSNEVLATVYPNIEEIYGTALENQPQVKSSQIKTMSSLVGYQVAKGGLMPKLFLAGSLKSGYSSARKLTTYSQVIQQQNIGYLQSNPSEAVVGFIPTTVPVNADYPAGKQFVDNFGQSISINLTVPIFNNLSVKSNMDKAKLNIENAKFNENAVKNQLRKAVEQAYIDVVSANKKYIASQEQVESEERTYFTLQKQFDVGLANAIDYVIEKNNYAKAILGLVQAKYDYIFKMKVLDFYQGKDLTL
ncbi:MAG TPA: TolC family protein [Bacteroidia bacterium]|nr:TolC family protein [Bacteroidia bacterium]